MFSSRRRRAETLLLDRHALWTGARRSPTEKCDGALIATQVCIASLCLLRAYDQTKRKAERRQKLESPVDADLPDTDDP